MAMQFPLVEALQGYDLASDLLKRQGDLSWHSTTAGALSWAAPGPFGERMISIDAYSNPPVFATLAEAQTGISIEFRATGQLRFEVGTTSASGGSGAHMTVTVDSFGALTVTLPNAAGATLYRSPNNVFNILGSYFLGFHTDISATAGTIIVQANGVTVASLSGLNTKSPPSTALASLDYLQFDTAIMGDICISPSGFVGEQHAPTGYFPTADSAVQWVPENTTGPNYTMVNHVTQTSVYNSTANVGDKDFFVLGGVPSDQQVKTASSKFYAWKDDSGLCQIAHAIKIGATVYVGETITLTSTPAWYSTSWPVNPSTGVAWLTGDLNAALKGYVRIT